MMQQIVNTVRPEVVEQSWYAEIYAIADDAQNAAADASPARLTQRMWTAIDQLRTKDASPDDIKLAERTSVALHRYNLSRHAKTASLGFELAATTGELSSLADMWLRRLAQQMSRH
jgi:hypothetical protein